MNMVSNNEETRGRPCLLCSKDIYRARRGRYFYDKDVFFCCKECAYYWAVRECGELARGGLLGVYTPPELRVRRGPIRNQRKEARR